MLAVSEILMPVKASASGILGVITSASGNKYLINAETACCCNKGAPPFAIITGSTTNVSNGR